MPPPPRKRLITDEPADADSQPAPKRRSARQAAAASAPRNEHVRITRTTSCSPEPLVPTSTNHTPRARPPAKPARAVAKPKSGTVAKSARETSSDVPTRGTSDVDSIPTTNPEAPRHDGEWYWLMKAEPETRLENGIDVSFSIDHLRARTKPEGWDGIRAYAARNHMRNMNAGDKAFFYHSNCREPGIVGIMEIVKEFSEDASAREPGTPYYDPKSTKENPRWSLVHVEFRKKFAVPITLKELRELGGPGGPLENMQMLKQSRLSVSRVSKEEWEALCEIADEKADEAGLAHEVGRA